MQSQMQETLTLTCLVFALGSTEVCIMRGRCGGSRRERRRGGDATGEGGGDGEGDRDRGIGEGVAHSRRGDTSLLIFRRRLYLRGPFCG